MQIVKLHATTSTNDELRARFRESDIPHLTALYSLSQTQGRGNRGTTWQSEDGKNLTFSVLIKEGLDDLNTFQLNQIVSVALIEWLRNDLRIQAKIKWPNDILSVQKKLAGMLIENTFLNGKWTHSIIGIGLNVNQEEFKELPNAISLKNLTGRNFKLEELLVQFLFHLKMTLDHKQESIDKYLLNLFKYQQNALFEINGVHVNAMVAGVNENGKLLLKHEDQLTAYDLKQVRWKY